MSIGACHVRLFFRLLLWYLSIFVGLANWQNIDLSTMMFPSEMKVDYIRVYQRKGHMNTGCNPKDYPRGMQEKSERHDVGFFD